MYNVIFEWVILSLSIIIPIFILVFYNKNIVYYSILIIMSFSATIGLNYDIFGIINSLQIMLAILSLFFLLKKYKNNLKIISVKKTAILFLIYMSIITIVGYYAKDYKLLGGITRNELRPYVQVFQFCCIIFTFIIALTLNDYESIKILKVFYYTLIVFACLGIFQTLVYYVSGFDLFPIFRGSINENQNESVISSFGLLRATAGVGEPKQFAKFMCIGLAITLLLDQIIKVNANKLFLSILFILAIILSDSTTGIIGSIIVLFLYIFKKMKKNVLFVAGLLILIIAIPYIIHYFGLLEKINYLNETYEVLFGLEDVDSITLSWLINEPGYLLTGTGIANTVAYAHEYVTNDNLLYVTKYVFTLRRGIIKIFAEGGLIGLILLLNMFKPIWKCIKKSDTVKHFFVFVLILFFFISCEAIFEIEMIILALIYNIGFVEKNKC